jgi:hypothetical protein
LYKSTYLCEKGAFFFRNAAVISLSFFNFSDLNSGENPYKLERVRIRQAKSPGFLAPFKRSQYFRTRHGRALEPLAELWVATRTWNWECEGTRIFHHHHFSLLLLPPPLKWTAVALYALPLYLITPQEKQYTIIDLTHRIAYRIAYRIYNRGLFA